MIALNVINIYLASILQNYVDIDMLEKFLSI